MDETKDIRDDFAGISDSSETANGFESAQNLPETDADFNLDKFLDAGGNASVEAPLNMVGEDESIADIKMEDWLSGISTLSEPESGTDENKQNLFDVAEAEVENAAPLFEFGNETADAVEGSDKVPGADAADQETIAAGETTALAEGEKNADRLFEEPEAVGDDVEAEIGAAENEKTLSEVVDDDFSAEQEADIIAAPVTENLSEDYADDGKAVDEPGEEESLTDEMPDEAEVNDSEPDDGFPVSSSEDFVSEDSLQMASDEPAENLQSFSEASLPVGELYGEAANYVKWYSGSVHDEMFEISKNDLPEEIIGTEDTRLLHINVGYDSYGWLVEFDGGPTMSLEDVRRYQIRNGALPGASGAIRYGQQICRFRNIERILIYQSVRYFSYGIS